MLVSDDIPQPVAEEGWDEDALKCVHREKDFISLLSCTPGQYNLNSITMLLEH